MNSCNFVYYHRSYIVYKINKLKAIFEEIILVTDKYCRYIAHKVYDMHE